MPNYEGQSVLDMLSSLNLELDKAFKELKLNMPSKPNMPISPSEVKPTRITVSGPATRVLWEDGEQTVVKRCPEDEMYDSAYVAFCIALAKRIYGSNSALHRVVDRHLDSYLISEQRKQKAAEDAARKQEESRRHARRVRNLAKKMRLEEEARLLMLSEESGAKAD